MKLRRNQKNKSEEFGHFLGGKSEIATEEFGQFLGRKWNELIFIMRHPCFIGKVNPTKVSSNYPPDIFMRQCLCALEYASKPLLHSYFISSFVATN